MRAERFERESLRRKTNYFREIKIQTALFRDVRARHHYVFRLKRYSRTADNKHTACTRKGSQHACRTVRRRCVRNFPPPPSARRESCVIWKFLEKEEEKKKNEIKRI